jgi:hypothetical protein
MRLAHLNFFHAISLPFLHPFTCEDRLSFSLSPYLSPPFLFLLIYIISFLFWLSLSIPLFLPTYLITLCFVSFFFYILHYPSTHLSRQHLFFFAFFLFLFMFFSLSRCLSVPSPSLKPSRFLHLSDEALGTLKFLSHQLVIGPLFRFLFMFCSFSFT